MKLCLSQCCCFLLWSNDAALLRSISMAAGVCTPKPKAKAHRYLTDTRGPGKGSIQVLPPFLRTPGLQKHHLLCVERMRNTPAASKAVSCTRRCVELKQLWGCFEISLSNPTNPLPGLSAFPRQALRSEPHYPKPYAAGCGSSSRC